MTHPVRLSALAALDIQQAREWHDAQEPGLGDQFLQRVDETITRIGQNPHQYIGKNAVEARDLSRKFVANPAWLLVFPGHDTVREVAVRSGDAVAASGSGGMCFFWHTSDRIFVIGAGKMNEELGVAIANSMADQHR